MDLIGWITDWDQTVVNMFQHELYNQQLRAFMEIITSSTNWLIPLFIIWLFLIFRGGPRGRAAAVLWLPMLLLTDALTAHVIKPLIGRPRPLGHGGYSLPSVHATNAFAMAALLSYFIRNLPFRVVAFSLAVAVAFSRVYIGVHYPTDVIAGALLGTIDALLIIVLYLLLKPALERKVPILFPPSPAASAEKTQ